MDSTGCGEVVCSLQAWQGIELLPSVRRSIMKIRELSFTWAIQAQMEKVRNQY